MGILLNISRRRPDAPARRTEPAAPESATAVVATAAAEPAGEEAA
jgi:hypothetical protein